jgi:O-antigen/teichoic acid export membrane protein
MPEAVEAETPLADIGGASALPEDGGRDVFRSARPTIVAGVVGKLVELPPLALMFTLVPRVLGPSRFGEFALGFFTVTLGSACVALSGAALMSRFIASAPPERRVHTAYLLGVDVAKRRLVQIAAVAVCGILLAVALPGRFPPAFVAIVVLALAIDLLATLCFQIALGLGGTTLWSFRYAIQNATILVSTLLLTAAFGAKAAVAGLLVGSVVALAIGVAAVFRPLAAAGTDKNRPEARLSADMSRFRTLKGLSNVLTQLAHRSGVILVAIIAGSRVQTGYAGLAIGASLTATYAIWQVFVVQLPAHSEQTARNQESVEVGLQRFARRAEFVSVALALVAAAILSPAVSLLLGDRFSGARSAFVFGIALVPLAPLTALGSQVATLRLRPEVEARAAAFGAAVFFVASLAAIPFWGATGAAAALLLSAVATVVVLLFRLRGAISPATAALAFGAVACVLAIRIVA